jgi:hypothetical protein
MDEKLTVFLKAGVGGTAHVDISLRAKPGQPSLVSDRLY